MNKRFVYKASVMLCSCLGLGFSPRGSATIGAFFGGIVFYFFISKYSLVVQICIIAIVFFLGVFGSKIITQGASNRDPKFIIIDEFAGVCVSFLFVPTNPVLIIGGIVIFRVFDKFKWLGISRMENLPHGWGVMLDDLIAGLYSGIVLSLLSLLHGPFSA